MFHMDAVDCLVSVRSPHRSWIAARGWAYLPGTESERTHVEVTLRLRGCAEAYRVSTSPLRRLDVVRALGEPHAEWAGFEALAPLAGIPAGEYTTGVRLVGEAGERAWAESAETLLLQAENEPALFARPALVSVHVPKTAGASMLGLLRASYRGSRFFHDTLTEPLLPVRLRCQRALIRWAARSLVPRDAMCIHGHFLATKYRRLLPNARTAIWFRDPASRLLSDFSYIRRTPMQFPLHDLQRRIQAGALDFEGFTRSRLYRNLQTTYLDGLSLEEIAFVGIQEEFDRSLALLGRIFGLEELPQVTPANVNPDKGVGEPYPVAPEIARLVGRYHRRDVDLYRRALAAFAALCRRHGV